MTPSTAELAARLVRYPDIATMHLERYFRTTVDIRMSQRAGFSGRFFESYVVKSQAEAPGHSAFTPWEILAVDSLGVQIPAAYVDYLLDPSAVLEHRGDSVLLGELMEACHIEVGSTSATPQVPAEGSAVDRLYRRIYTLKGMGHVKTSKLLAAKFPHHVPISDTRVNALLGFLYGSNRSGVRWWSAVGELLRSDDLVDVLDRADGCPPTPSVGLLRRLDVVLWMEHRWYQRYERLVAMLDGRPLKQFRSIAEGREREARRLVDWFDGQRDEKHLSRWHEERLEALAKR